MKNDQHIWHASDYQMINYPEPPCMIITHVTGRGYSKLFLSPSDELLAQVDDSELSKFTCFIVQGIIM